jgi:hypothetical protein
MSKSLQFKGEIPNKGRSEYQQFIRVESIIRSELEKTGQWAFICRSVPYQHRQKGCIGNDQDWNGEIDLLIITEDRIIIYELKSTKMRLIHGRPDRHDWKWENGQHEEIKAKSDYMQLNLQRVALLKDKLETLRAELGISADMHFRIDARLVYRDETDISGYKPKFPRDFHRDEFESAIINSIADTNDKASVRKAYIIETTNYKGDSLLELRPGLSHQEKRNLYRIFAQNDMLDYRKRKWFRIIHEHDLLEDIGHPGYQDFQITREQAASITEWLYTALAVEQV